MTALSQSGTLNVQAVPIVHKPSIMPGLSMVSQVAMTWPNPQAFWPINPEPVPDTPNVCLSRYTLHHTPDFIRPCHCKQTDDPISSVLQYALSLPFCIDGSATDNSSSSLLSSACYSIVTQWIPSGCCYRCNTSSTRRAPYFPHESI